MLKSAIGMKKFTNTFRVKSTALLQIRQLMIIVKFYFGILKRLVHPIRTEYREQGSWRLLHDQIDRFFD